MPTSPITTFANQRLEPAAYPMSAKTIAVKLKASVTLTKGTILGELTATPGTYAAYASGNADGTQTPKLILAYDAATDASGNITLGGQATGGEWGQTEPSVAAYMSGAFYTTDLAGLDANAVTVMGGHLAQGTVSNGIFVLPL